MFLAAWTLLNEQRPWRRVHYLTKRQKADALIARTFSSLRYDVNSTTTSMDTSTFSAVIPRQGNKAHEAAWSADDTA